MNDLEMTRLCVEAIGFHIRTDRNDGDIWCEDALGNNVGHYDPLHDDAQAMALVKNFYLRTEWLVSKDWVALYGGNNAPNDRCVVSSNTDLNRAIVECVAKMQQDKVKP